MSTATEARAALQVVAGVAVDRAVQLFDRLHGSPETRRYTMLDGVPALIGYYTDGTAALAADFYQDERDSVLGPGGYQARTIVADRTVKIRRAIAWSAEPLFDGGEAQAVARLAEVVQFEVAKPFRDTITGNRREDPEAVGWRRVTSGGCSFCQMLAAKGAVYHESSARFASHPHCHCSAAPVFRGGESGPPASAMQYVASKRTRTPEQRAALRDYLATYH
jgi:hypothetical protein